MKLTGRWLAMGSLGLVLLAGCTQEPASAAATVADTRIDLQEVSDQLLAINEVLGAPPDAADVSFTNTVLRNNVVYELVEQAAGAAGATVTETAVDERLQDQIEFVGSLELLEQQAAQAGVAPEMIEVDIRVSLLAEALAADLAGGTELPPEEQQQLLIAEVQRYSADAGTTVNPRFGVWDANSLSIVDDPDAPSAPPELGLIGFP
jgi:hypothetical protein